MKINLRSIMLVASLGCLLWSCTKTANNAGMSLDKNLVKNADKYAALLEKRTGGSSSFTIEDIKRNGDVLTISVKGGCKEEDFQMVWDGRILLSYPGQVNLVLYNDALSGCDIENPFNITVNLRKIIDKQDPKDFIFNIANGSVKQDKSLNPNGSVSSN